MSGCSSDYSASRDRPKIVIHGPRFLLGNGASFTRRKFMVLSCSVAPKSSVGHTGKHCSRTAVAAVLYVAVISLGLTFVAVIRGRPRSSPSELMPKRSVTDDPAVPSGTCQHVAKCSRSSFQSPTLTFLALHAGATCAARRRSPLSFWPSGGSASRGGGPIR